MTKKFLGIVIASLVEIMPYSADARPVLFPCDTPQRIDFVQIPTLIGLSVQTRAGSDYVRQDVFMALLSVVDRASRDGYTIVIQSACRSYRDQLHLARHGSGATIARPGHSRHGYGVAVDATLADSFGHDLIGLDMRSRPQCSLGQQKMKYVRKLCDYFFAAGWTRLKSETWHFEYGTQGPYLGRCSGYASLCHCTGPSDCRVSK